MLFPETWFELKDGRKALLRSPREEDIPGMLEYLRVTSGETDFLLRYPEECDKYTPEGERELFNRVNAASNETMIVCLVDGRIAGNCQISRATGLKVRHRARVAIALLQEFWGLGIGKEMFRQMVAIAGSWDGVIQMELEFIEGNTRARALYEKMGFRIVGVHPNAIRLKDGTLRGEYLMIREIHR